MLPNVWESREEGEKKEEASFWNGGSSSDFPLGLRWL